MTGVDGAASPQRIEKRPLGGRYWVKAVRCVKCRLMKWQASLKTTPRKAVGSNTPNTTPLTTIISWNNENRWLSFSWGQTTTDWPTTCTRHFGLETLEYVHVEKNRWMQHTSFKTAPGLLRSIRDTGQQQQRFRKNSTTALRAYKQRLPLSKQLAWTSKEVNEKKKKKKILKK